MLTSASRKFSEKVGRFAAASRVFRAFRAPRGFALFFPFVCGAVFVFALAAPARAQSDSCTVVSVPANPGRGDVCVPDSGENNILADAQNCAGAGWDMRSTGEDIWRCEVPFRNHWLGNDETSCRLVNSKIRGCRRQFGTADNNGANIPAKHANHDSDSDNPTRYAAQCPANHEPDSNWNGVGIQPCAPVMRSVAVSDSPFGTVVATVAGSEAVENDSTNAPATDPVTFAATPDDGYYVAAWTGVCENNPTATTGENDPPATPQTCVAEAGSENIAAGATFAPIEDCASEHRAQTTATTCGDIDYAALAAAQRITGADVVRHCVDAGGRLGEFHAIGPGGVSDLISGVANDCFFGTDDPRNCHGLKTETTIPAGYEPVALSRRCDDVHPLCEAHLVRAVAGNPISGCRATNASCQSVDENSAARNNECVCRDDYEGEFGDCRPFLRDCEENEDPADGDCKWTVNLNPGEKGNLLAKWFGDDDLRDGESVPSGTTVTFFAAPDPGYYVSGWTGCAQTADNIGSVDNTQEQQCAAVVAAQLTVGATFNNALVDRCRAAGKVANAARDACVAECLVGQGDDGGQCVPCRGGTYSAEAGPGSCIPCENGIAGGEMNGGFSTCECNPLHEKNESGICVQVLRTVSVAVVVEGGAKGGRVAAAAGGRDIGEVAPVSLWVTITALPEDDSYLRRWGGTCRFSGTAADLPAGTPHFCVALPGVSPIDATAVFDIARDCAGINRVAMSATRCGGCVPTFADPNPGSVSESGCACPLGTGRISVFFSAEALRADSPDPRCAATDSHEAECARSGWDYLNYGGLNYGGAKFCSFASDGSTILDSQSGEVVSRCVIFGSGEANEPQCADVFGADIPDKLSSPREFVFKCPSAVSDDRSTCLWAVNLTQNANGDLSAKLPDGAELRSGGTVPDGTTVTFTADPDSGYYVAAWTGCESTPENTGWHADPEAKECAAIVGETDLTVGATFADIDECQTIYNYCDPNASCRDHLFPGVSVVCECNPGFLGNGWTCRPARTVHISRGVGGTITAAWVGNLDVRNGEMIGQSVRLTFTARPTVGFYVSGWTGDCENNPTATTGENDPPATPETCQVGPGTSDIHVGATFAPIANCASRYRTQETATTCGDDVDYAALVAGQRISGADVNRFCGGAGGQATEMQAVLFFVIGLPPSVLDAGFRCRFGDGDPRNCHAVNSDANIPADYRLGTGASNGLCDNVHPLCQSPAVARLNGNPLSGCVYPVRLAASVNGTVAARWAGDDLNDGDLVPEGATVTFAAVPDYGYYVSVWIGCESTPENIGDHSDSDFKECAAAATAGLAAVGAVFADIDECQTRRNDCDVNATCENNDNRPGRRPRCECNTGYVGGGQTCSPARTAEISPVVNGTLSARWAGAPNVENGGAVPRDALVTFVAEPAEGFYVSQWTGACATDAEPPPLAATTGENDPPERAQSCVVGPGRADFAVGAIFDEIRNCARRRNRVNRTATSCGGCADTFAVANPDDANNPAVTCRPVASCETGQAPASANPTVCACDAASGYADPTPDDGALNCELVECDSDLGEIRDEATCRCPNGETATGGNPNSSGTCVSSNGVDAANACEAAGWPLTAPRTGCAIPVHDHSNDDGPGEFCALSSDCGRLFADANGDSVPDFPAYDAGLDEPTPRRFAMYCQNGQEPGGKNDAAQTECATFPTVYLTPPANGTLSAGWARNPAWPGFPGDDDLQSGDAVPPGTTVTFTATPESADWHVAWWTGNCKNSPSAQTGGDDAAGGLKKNCELETESAANITVGAVFKENMVCEPDNRAARSGAVGCGACLPTFEDADSHPVAASCECPSGASQVEVFLNGSDFLSDSPDNRCVASDSIEAECALSGWDYLNYGGAQVCSFARDGSTLEDAQTGAIRTRCVIGGGSGPRCADLFGGNIPDRLLSPREIVFNCPDGAGIAADRSTCTWTVELNLGANGTLSASWTGGGLPDGGTVPHGATVTFTATPDEGYYVVGWTGCEETPDNTGLVIDGESKQCAARADSNLTVGAEFKSRRADVCPNGFYDPDGVEGEDGTGLNCVRKRITVADLREWCRPSGLSAPLHSLGAGVGEPAVGSFCHLANDPSRNCFVLDDGIVILAGTTLMDVTPDSVVPSFGAYPAGLCDVVYPDCADGGQVPVETGNPLSGCADPPPRPRRVNFTRLPPGGSMAAAVNGTAINSGDVAPLGAEVVFSARPSGAGFYVSEWTGACAAEANPTRAETGADDAAGGAPKVCAITVDGRSDIQVGVVFAPAPVCGNDNRGDGDRVDGCGECLRGHSDAGDDPDAGGCVAGDVGSAADSCEDAGWTTEDGRQFCVVASRIAGDASGDMYCHFADANPALVYSGRSVLWTSSVPCAEVFGSPPVFPTFAADGVGDAGNPVLYCSGDGELVSADGGSCVAACPGSQASDGGVNARCVCGSGLVTLDGMDCAAVCPAGERVAEGQCVCNADREVRDGACVCSEAEAIDVGEGVCAQSRAVSVLGSDNGVVAATVLGAEVAEAGSARSPVTVPVTFVAAPDGDYYVQSWTGDCLSNPSAGTGEGDAMGGVPKTCVVSAGSADISAGAVFGAVRDCGSENREGADGVLVCGVCSVNYEDFNSDGDCTACDSRIAGSVSEVGGSCGCVAGAITDGSLSFLNSAGDACVNRSGCLVGEGPDETGRVCSACVGDEFNPTAGESCMVCMNGGTVGDVVNGGFTTCACAGDYAGTACDTLPDCPENSSRVSDADRCVCDVNYSPASGSPDSGTDVVCALDMRSVSVSVSDGGVVVATVSGLEVSESQATPSPVTVPVTFVATPDGGYYVESWTGDCLSNPSAGTGEGDATGGVPKTCVVSAGSADISAGAVFGAVRDCGSESRKEAVGVLVCGTCADDYEDVDGTCSACAVAHSGSTGGAACSCDSDSGYADPDENDSVLECLRVLSASDCDAYGGGLTDNDTACDCSTARGFSGESCNVCAGDNVRTVQGSVVSCESPTGQAVCDRAEGGALEFRDGRCVSYCEAGQQRDSGTGACVACAAGTYNPTAGAACQSCNGITGDIENGGATSCAECENGGARAGDNSNACSCVGDYYGDTCGERDDCPANSSRGLDDGDRCVCDVNYSASLDGPSSGTDVVCALDMRSVSVLGSDNGVVVATVLGAEVAEGGLARSPVTDAVTFVAAPDSDYYVLEWTGDCDNNPSAGTGEGDATGGGSKSCVVSAGSSDVSAGAVFGVVRDCGSENREDASGVLVCGACSVNYEDFNGDGDCTACDSRIVGSVSEVGGSCGCVPGAITDESLSFLNSAGNACVNRSGCLAGEGPDETGRVCSACVGDEFNPTAGESCMVCMNGTVGDVVNGGFTTCACAGDYTGAACDTLPDCPSNSSRTTDADKCVCDVNYSPASGSPSSGVDVVCALDMRLVSVSVSDGGVVVATVSGLEVSESQATPSPVTEPVTFVATPDGGYYVESWTGDCLSNPSAGTGEGDATGGGSKSCVVDAGSSDIEAGATFAAVRDCGDENREGADGVLVCGSCADDFEEAGGSCVACAGGRTSMNGESCACPVFAPVESSGGNCAAFCMAGEENVGETCAECVADENNNATYNPAPGGRCVVCGDNGTRMSATVCECDSGYAKGASGECVVAVPRAEMVGVVAASLVAAPEGNYFVREWVGVTCANDGDATGDADNPGAVKVCELSSATSAAATVGVVYLYSRTATLGTVPADGTGGTVYATVAAAVPEELSDGDRVSSREFVFVVAVPAAGWRVTSWGEAGGVCKDAPTSQDENDTGAKVCVIRPGDDDLNVGVTFESVSSGN